MSCVRNNTIGTRKRNKSSHASYFIVTFKTVILDLGVNWLWHLSPHSPPGWTGCSDWLEGTPSSLTSPGTACLKLLNERGRPSTLEEDCYSGRGRLVAGLALLLELPTKLLRSSGGMQGGQAATTRKHTQLGTSPWIPSVPNRPVLWTSHSHLDLHSCLYRTWNYPLFILCFPNFTIWEERDSQNINQILHSFTKTFQGLPLPFTFKLLVKVYVCFLVWHSAPVMLGH